MIHKYKKIYQTQDETISEVCVEWTGFDYDRPSGCAGTADIDFSYIDCAGATQSVTFTVPCDAPLGGYELITPLCVRDASVIEVAGASVTSIIYGASC